MDTPKGIRMRGDKFFVDVSYKGNRRTATVGTMQEAIARKEAIRADLERGKQVRNIRANAAGWTLQQALDKTLSIPPKLGWKGCSYEKQATLNAQDAINYFGPDRKLSALSLDDIDAWLQACEAKGNSDSTINRKRSALSKLVKVAVEYGGLEAPIKLPGQRKEPVGRIRQISKDEEAELLEWFRVLGFDPMDKAVMVLIDTGLRRGELLNLRPSDVDFSTGVIMVYGTEGKGTKNGKIRSVPMTERVRQVLSKRTRGQLCFGDLTEDYMRRTWDRVRGHMGLTGDKDFTLHVCRHTCASRLVSKGVSLPIVQQWLGHSNIQTTMRYSHLYPTDLMNAVKALEG